MLYGRLEVKEHAQMLYMQNFGLYIITFQSSNTYLF